ncbi:hypothetical protein BEN49_22525 [Hymenobacter coccineus]|uniref:Uncharacterized protein n=1 Tax=Hymenobacter coccineus TaxID=1908235 RepID=A0A1G1TI10_9BACT|nr:hypothetical protein BEN49_22525 [Hymenobacter coccineus]
MQVLNAQPRVLADVHRHLAARKRGQQILRRDAADEADASERVVVQAHAHARGVRSTSSTRRADESGTGCRA